MYDMLHAGDRVAMDWDTYESLGPEVRGEYVEGALIMSPSPTQRHQRIIRNLVMAIAEVVPAGIDVLSEWAWKPAEDEFVPDVVVFDQTDDEPWMSRDYHQQHTRVQAKLSLVEVPNPNDNGHKARG